MLPHGKYAAVTWSIPSNFGGMTKAMLERSASFCRYGGVAVDVLTFDWRSSYNGVREELSSTLPPGVRILNFWEELAAIEDGSLEQVSEWSVVPTVSPSAVPAADDFRGTPTPDLTRRREEHETSSRDQYFRPDGTVFLSNELHHVGETQRRHVRLISRSGRTVASFASMRDVYCAWLDYWHDGRDSYLVIDSKYTANWLVGYKRENVVLTYLFHGSHLADGIASPFGRLRRSRRYAFLKAHEFDAVCALTSRQLSDMACRIGGLDILHVAPNGHGGGSLEHTTKRDPLRGVVIGRIDPGKRIDHAIRALGAARKSSALNAKLNIFGTGPDEPNLRSLVRDLDLSGIVSFGGFTKRPSEEFERSSFSLLASKSEGFGLVLVESMNAGCIPIAYDVPYGPADIIHHGVNGFLVPTGDVRALARTIEYVMRMPEDDLEIMRRAAIARANDFSHPKIVRLWGQILTAARAQKNRRPAPKLRIRGASVTHESSGNIRISCEAAVQAESECGHHFDRLFIAFYQRNGMLFGRTGVDEIAKRGDALLVAAEVGESLRGAPARILDVYLEASGAGGLESYRLPFRNGRYGGGFYGTAYRNMSFFLRGQ